LAPSPARNATRDIGTLLGDFQHDGRADTAIVSGDDGGLSFEIHHFLPD
jgi:hypothetical protein